MANKISNDMFSKERQEARNSVREAAFNTAGVQDIAGTGKMLLECHDASKIVDGTDAGLLSAMFLMLSDFFADEQIEKIENDPLVNVPFIHDSPSTKQ